MRKKWFLPCLVILAVLLSACADTGAGTSVPESDAVSAPSSVAASGPVSPEPDSIAPDSVEPEEADEPEAGPHTLDKEEKAALWQQLDGIWRMDDPGQLEYEPLFEFIRYEDGQFVLCQGIVYSEGSMLYIDEMTEQDGVYTFSVYQSVGVMTSNEYEPDARDTYMLSLNEDGTVELSAYGPARCGWDATPASAGEEDGYMFHWRRAIPEEEELVNAGGSGYLMLENGEEITAGWSLEPARYHHETPEEEQARMQGW